MMEGFPSIIEDFSASQFVPVCKSIGFAINLRKISGISGIGMQQKEDERVTATAETHS